MHPITEDRVVRIQEFAARCSVSRRTLYDWMRIGLLPRPLKIGPRARGYRESTLYAFLDSRNSRYVHTNK